MLKTDSKCLSGNNSTSQATPAGEVRRKNDSYLKRLAAKSPKQQTALVRFNEGGLLGEYPFTTIPVLLRAIWDDLMEFDYNFTTLQISLPNGKAGIVTCLDMHTCFAEGRITEIALAKRVFSNEGKEATL